VRAERRLCASNPGRTYVGGARAYLPVLLASRSARAIWDRRTRCPWHRGRRCRPVSYRAAFFGSPPLEIMDSRVRGRGHDRQVRPGRRLSAGRRPGIALVGQGELTDLRMAEWLGFPRHCRTSCRCQSRGELGAAVEQFREQRGDGRVAKCVGGERAQVGGGCLGGTRPVGEQFPGCPVEERVQDRVAPLGRPARQIGNRRVCRL
jgi:hypothetical protein